MTFTDEDMLPPNYGSFKALNCPDSLHCVSGVILTCKEPCKSCSRRKYAPGIVDHFFPTRHYDDVPRGTFKPYKEQPA